MLGAGLEALTRVISVPESEELRSRGPKLLTSVKVRICLSVEGWRRPRGVGRYPSFSFSISPSNEYSGLIFFRMDWLDLLAVQGTLKSLLQHHSSKASILWCSAFFIGQLSHPYMTTGKTIAFMPILGGITHLLSLLFSPQSLSDSLRPHGL